MDRPKKPWWMQARRGFWRMLDVAFLLFVLDYAVPWAVMTPLQVGALIGVVFLHASNSETFGYTRGLNKIDQLDEQTAKAIAEAAYATGARHACQAAKEVVADEMARAHLVQRDLGPPN